MFMNSGVSHQQQLKSSVDESSSGGGCGSTDANVLREAGSYRSLQQVVNIKVDVTPGGDPNATVMTSDRVVMRVASKVMKSGDELQMNY